MITTIFHPGVNSSTILILNTVLFALLLVILSLIFYLGNTDYHTLFFLFVCTGLIIAVNWFVAMYDENENQEETTDDKKNDKHNTDDVITTKRITRSSSQKKSKKAE